jgi:hypothetical protein
MACWIACAIHCNIYIYNLRATTHWKMTWLYLLLLKWPFPHTYTPLPFSLHNWSAISAFVGRMIIIGKFIMNGSSCNISGTFHAIVHKVLSITSWLSRCMYHIKQSCLHKFYSGQYMSPTATQIKDWAQVANVCLGVYFMCDLWHQLWQIRVLQSMSSHYTACFRGRTSLVIHALINTLHTFVTMWHLWILALTGGSGD